MQMILRYVNPPTHPLGLVHSNGRHFESVGALEC